MPLHDIIAIGGSAGSMEALRELIPYSARLCTQHAEAPLWHGYRVLALTILVLFIAPLLTIGIWRLRAPRSGVQTT